MTAATDVLVLGASGPIGAATVRAIRSAGLSARGASRSGDPAVDVAVPAEVRRVLAETRPTALVYLVNTPGATPDQAAATLGDVVAAAAAAGTRRIVFASSAAVYGDQDGRPYREDAPLAGSSDYAIAKMRSEAVLSRVAGEAGVSAVALRIFNVFGPGCRSSLVNMLADSPRPSLRMTAGLTRDYVHVDDVAAAVVAAVTRSDVTGAVNIGRGVPVDNLQLAAAAGDDAYLPVAGEVRSLSVADVSSARARLGWAATIDPLEVLRERAQRRSATTRS